MSQNAAKNPQNAAKIRNMRLFWLTVKHCAKSERFDDDKQTCSVMVIEMPIALSAPTTNVPLFFSLLTFLREAWKNPDHHGHCCPLWMMIVVKLMRTLLNVLLPFRDEI